MPFHHQYLLSQFFRTLVLGSGSTEYADFKHYNFSGIKGQTKVSRGGLHFNSNRVTVVISSGDPAFMQFMLRLIFKLEEIKIGNLLLAPEAADEEVGVEFEPESKFVCISPIVILKPTFNDQEGKRFINPDTDEFSDILFESTLSRMEGSGIDTAKIDNIQKFQLLPDEKYLEKIRISNKKFARIYPVYDLDMKLEVRGYTFPFTLFAAPEVQNFIFVNGLGLYTHKGFGMLDIAHSDPSHNIVEYKELKNLIAT